MPEALCTLVESPYRDPPEGLAHDAVVHLAVAQLPLLERDGNLDDPQARLDGSVGQVDLEHIAGTADGMKLDPAQCRRTEGPIATGDVTDGDAERQPGARAVSRMRQSALDSAAVCLLRESNSNRRLADLLAEGTAMRIREVDPLALSLAADDADFAAFLTDFTRTVAGCLRGPAS